MNSGQWSIASSRPLPSLSSAKSFVPKPLGFVLPASSSRSLKDTVDDLSVVAFRKSKCTASSWLHGLLIRPSVARASSCPTGSPMGILSPRTMPQSGGMKETTPPKLTSLGSLIPKSILKSLGVSGWVLVTVSVSAGLKSALALSVLARTSRKDSTPATTPHSRSCFALTSFLSFLGLAPASFLAAFLVWRSPLQGGRRLPVVFITRPCGRSYLSRRALIRREATVPSEPIIPADPRPAATSAQAGTPLPAGDRLPTPVTGPAAPPAAAPAAPTPARVPAAPLAAPAEAPAAAPIALVTGTLPTTGGSVVW